MLWNSSRLMVIVHGSSCTYKAKTKTGLLVLILLQSISVFLFNWNPPIWWCWRLEAPATDPTTHLPDGTRYNARRCLESKQHHLKGFPIGLHCHRTREYETYSNIPHPPEQERCDVVYNGSEECRIQKYFSRQKQSPPCRDQHSIKCSFYWTHMLIDSLSNCTKNFYFQWPNYRIEIVIKWDVYDSVINVRTNPKDTRRMATTE